MIGHVSLGELDLATVAIGFAALAYVVQVLLDSLGWSRTSRTLRVENEDLVRRNAELEDEVRRLEQSIGELKGRLDDLTKEVHDLRARDQEAVLKALFDHEDAATQRATAIVAALDRIAEANR